MMAEQENEFAEFHPALQEMANLYPNVADKLREFQAAGVSPASWGVGDTRSSEDVAKDTLRARLPNVRPWKYAAGETQFEKKKNWAAQMHAKWIADQQANGPMPDDFDWLSISRAEEQDHR